MTEIPEDMLEGANLTFPLFPAAFARKSPQLLISLQGKLHISDPRISEQCSLHIDGQGILHIDFRTRGYYYGKANVLRALQEHLPRILHEEFGLRMPALEEPPAEPDTGSRVLRLWNQQRGFLRKLFKPGPPPDSEYSTILRKVFREDYAQVVPAVQKNLASVAASIAAQVTQLQIAQMEEVNVETRRECRKITLPRTERRTVTCEVEGNIIYLDRSGSVSINRTSFNMTVTMKADELKAEEIGLHGFVIRRTDDYIQIVATGPDLSIYASNNETRGADVVWKR